MSAAFSSRLHASSATNGGLRLNDVHSRLNATQVAGVVRPKDIPAAQALVHSARRTGTTFAVMGAQHAMGGQQFLSGGCVLDASALDRVIEFDPDSGRVVVEAGIRWPALRAWLAAHPANAQHWTIRQKQTGANDFSLGGALASNIHGRGLAFPPFVDDVESIELIDASGRLIFADRTRNGGLFALVAGGYGLFGLVVRLTLRLVRRTQMVRDVCMSRSAHLVADFDAAVARGCTHGDFQFAVNPGNQDFLDRGILSCYRPTEGQDATEPARRLRDMDFAGLLLLAHVDPDRAFAEYAKFYLATDGQRYGSDEHQFGVDLRDYHCAVDRHLGHCGSEMITELFVPRARLASFMLAAADSLKRSNAQPVYGTVRLVERDSESFLAWARESWACVVFNLHVRHDGSGPAAASGAFRALIDDAIAHGGSFYLTYHRWATRAQIEVAHPRFERFLHLKRDADPESRWSSDWYRHHCRLFGIASK